MTLERDIEILKMVPFFADLPAEPLKLLAFSAEGREYADQTKIFEEGEPADGGIVVMSGRVDLVRDSLGRDRPVASLGPGGMIGELALLVETARPASAIAVGRSTKLYTIRRATFRRILEEYPDITLDMQSKIAGRIAALDPALGSIARQLGAIDGE